MSFEKFLRGIVVAGVFAIPFIPLLVAQSMFFPFITGKNFAFRILVELIFALWLALALVNPYYRPRRSWILYAFVLFVCIMALADAFAVYPLKAFWSNYERMEGWVTLIHLLGLFVVATAVLNTEKLRRYWWETSMGVSVLIGLFAVLQLFGFFTINQGGVRLDATFGNAIYLAIYMLFHLFIAALFIAQKWSGHDTSVSKGVTFGSAIALEIFAAYLVFAGNSQLLSQNPGKAWLALFIFTAGIWGFAYGRSHAGSLSQWSLFTAMFLQAFALFFTASRGTLIGLIGGVLLSAFLLVVLANGSRNAWRASVGVVVGMLVLIGAFFVLRHTAIMQSIEPLRRISEISFSDNTIAARFYNMGMAIKGIQQRPLLGWGQEGYNFVFNKNYDPRMYGQEQWFDRTHNVIFDWLVAGGLLGFLAYMSLYLAALWALWRGNAFSVAEQSILTGLFAGYFFSILFVFDNITSYILFTVVLAYIASRASETAGKPRVFESIAFSRNTLWGLAPAGIVLGAVLVWAVNWNAYAANRTLITALQQYPAGQGGINTNIALFKQALSYDSFGDQEIREQLAQGAAGAAGGNIPDAQKQALFNLAVDEMKKQEASSPEDARFPFFLGILYGAYGQSIGSVKELKQALALSPTKQTIKFQLAYALTQANDANGALDLLKSAYESAPQFPEPHIMYAAMLVNMSQNALADKVIKPLLDEGTAADQRLISAYAAQKRYDKIAEIWASKARVAPTDVQARLALAASYYAAGEKQKAIDTLTKAAQDIPSIAPQATQLIDQIKAGTVKLQ